MSLSDTDVSRDICANCDQPRSMHQFTRGGARCVGGRTTFALSRPPRRSPEPPPPETWKHTIIVFGTGDGPDIDQMVKAEQHAVIALGGTRSIARGGLLDEDESDG